MAIASLRRRVLLVGYLGACVCVLYAAGNLSSVRYNFQLPTHLARNLFFAAGVFRRLFRGGWGFAALLTVFHISAGLASFFTTLQRKLSVKYVMSFLLHSVKNAL